MERGCTRGTMQTPQGRFVLATDTVQIGGRRVPGRELAVLNDAGRAVAFVDRSAGGYRVFLVPGGDDSGLLPAVEMIAVAFGALLDSGATPEGCALPD